MKRQLLCKQLALKFHAQIKRNFFGTNRKRNKKNNLCRTCVTYNNSYIDQKYLWYVLAEYNITFSCKRTYNLTKKP